MHGGRAGGILWALIVPQGMWLCCCVAVLTEGNGNLLPFFSQLVCLVLRITQALFKHARPVHARR